MTEQMNGLLAEARKNKYSTIKEGISEDDIAAVWENVSTFIEKQMAQQKGVTVQTLGTFTFTQKKLDIGNNKFILIQRPVFNISEKLAQSQGLQYVKHHVPGQIPVVQLNYAAMSFESPFDRDVVESCVREILSAVQRAIGAKKNVELTFNGIGRLTIRDSRVKMKFYKEFITNMDGSGKLLDSLQNRPGTVDSVMSERSVLRPQSSNTVILPRISNTNLQQGGLGPLMEGNEEYVPDDPAPVAMELDEQSPRQPGMEDPTAPGYTTQEGIEGAEDGDINTSEAIRNIENEGQGPTMGKVGFTDPVQAFQMDTDNISDPTKKPPTPPSRSTSRMTAPMAKATGFSLLDDLVPSPMTPQPPPSLYKPSPPPSDVLQKPQAPPTSPKHLAPLQRSVSFDQLKPGDSVLTPPSTACGHSNAGQELCYLCHQRSRRNVPVSFNEERRRREEEEDRLLQQYQYMKDAENVLNDQEMQLSKRHNLQKMAAFNLGVSEGMHQKKHLRDTDFHRSYIFQRRPLTPPRFYKQGEYSEDLSKQVNAKDTVKSKRKSDEEFLERLEQVQLAEDLAAQRDQFLKDKADEQDKYKQALESQIRTNAELSMDPMFGYRSCSSSSSSTRLPWMPISKTIRPFSEPNPSRLNENWKPFSGKNRLRFKPLQVPAREPDKEVFGKNDMTNEKMSERRRRAYEMFHEQQDLVAQRKREAILKRLAEQNEEEQVLDRTKREMHEDRANRFTRRMLARKRLEDDWIRASDLKQDRSSEDHMRAMSPGILLHEQCDRYNRCAQCKRMLKNCGESNLWSESRYIPGSRLMV